MSSQSDSMIASLGAAYKRLQEECGGAHRAARREHRAFVGACIVAAVMFAAAIVGWGLWLFRG